VILAMLLAAAAPQTAVEAEREFAAMAQTRGLWTAFRATAADGAVLFVPEEVDARTWLKDRKDPLLGYMWWPAKAFVSCDGRTAATTGPSVLGKTRGYFTTIWQKQADGSWKWVLDHGNALATPVAAGDKVIVRRASCRNRPALTLAPAARTIESSRAKSYLSGDRTLMWDYAVGTAGDRRVRVLVWNERGYETVIDDRVVAGQ
jgi:hypothetical protein